MKANGPIIHVHILITIESLKKKKKKKFLCRPLNVTFSSFQYKNAIPKDSIVWEVT